MGFKTTIKQLRGKAGLSQQDVADKIGIARATYAGLETGRRDPNLTEIREIAEYYQVSPSDLIDGKVSLINEQVIAYTFDDKLDTDIEPRDIDPKFNPEKLREVLLYILEKIVLSPTLVRQFYINCFIL
jgi:transcriptional regulator with XRE-family HTH domain